VVIHNLNLMAVAIYPLEADTPLVIDTNAALTLAVAV
jgi:hypothetical protein